MDPTKNGKSQSPLQAAAKTESSSSTAATAAPSSSTVYGLSSVLLPPWLRGVSSSCRIFSLLKTISAPIFRRCFLTRLLLSPPLSSTTGTAAAAAAFVDGDGVAEKEDVVPVSHATDILACSGFCRLRFVSYLYQRGWRQNFCLSGFPGPEKEFELMKDYLRPAMGGNIVDVSCGSGMFSGLFAKSGLFSPVVALDYSENMLQQCCDFIKQEQNFPKEKLILVRGDIAILPFLSNSVDGVHAGAAMHCWPSPTAAVAKVCVEFSNLERSSLVPPPYLMASPLTPGF